MLQRFVGKLVEKWFPFPTLLKKKRLESAEAMAFEVMEGTAQNLHALAGRFAGWGGDPKRCRRWMVVFDVQFNGIFSKAGTLGEGGKVD